MLDPAQSTPLDLTDFSTYIASCLELARQRLGDYSGPEAVAADEDRINQYPRLEGLGDPRDIHVFGPETLGEAEIAAARQALARGKVLLEHTCAGEATRLGLGTKYLINPPRDLTPEVMERLLGGAHCQLSPQELRPLSLGQRHMLQLAWDLSHLAREMGRDPAEVLATQHLLVIVNQATAEQVVQDFRQSGFYGFARQKVMFMVQEAFHGISKAEDWFYDQDSPKRLHNHGQMLMQTTMDHQLFVIDDSGGRASLPWSDYRDILARMDDKISFNIEDLDYLAMALDLPGLAVALKLGGQGYRMVMEVVANNPDNPQKGGSCAWDPELGRNVMIESFQLAGLPNSRITHLNKNINHYPKPVVAVSAVRERGLAMPIAVKNGFLYFQPIQGDVNFLVDTAFVRRSQLRPIRAWKSGVHTPLALEAMAAQDARPGFLDWARSLTGQAL